MFLLFRYSIFFRYTCDTVEEVLEKWNNPMPMMGPGPANMPMPFMGPGPADMPMPFEG